MKTTEWKQLRDGIRNMFRFTDQDDPEKISMDRLSALISRQETFVDRHRREAAEAVQFRPSYAPKGRPTRRESETKAQLQESEKLLSYYQTVKILRSRNLPLDPIALEKALTAPKVTQAPRPLGKTRKL